LSGTAALTGGVLQNRAIQRNAIAENGILARDHHPARVVRADRSNMQAILSLAFVPDEATVAIEKAGEHGDLEHLPKKVSLGLAQERSIGSVHDKNGSFRRDALASHAQELEIGPGDGNSAATGVPGGGDRPIRVQRMPQGKTDSNAHAWFSDR
jgi:hypothetical protein